jgi:acyl-coenzyme A synthetase/AMP-(fatty) acid ligase
MLPAVDGTSVSVHPNVFHDLLDSLPVKQWQVDQQTDGLMIKIVPGEAAVDQSHLTEALQRALETIGALAPRIHIALADAIPKTALGKAPLIRALAKAVRHDSGTTA